MIGDAVAGNGVGAVEAAGNGTNAGKTMNSKFACGIKENNMVLKWVIHLVN
jgi:hypothetical protein